jgi:hypothetical protein
MKYIILINYRDNETYIKLSCNIIYHYIYNNISKDITLLYIDNYINNNDINNNVIYISYSFVLYNYIDLFLKSNLIIINMDHYQHFNFKELILNKINRPDLNISIFDYNPINIKGILNEYALIKIYYMPLAFDRFLIDYYNNFNLKKKNFFEKEYDILFYGSINERRSKILDELSKKYKVNILNVKSPHLCTDEELINSIENSKIILNIYYYDYNKIFDYYRNSFLIANNVLLISEYPDDIDFNIEKNLEGIENHIILSKYEDIINTIDYVLNFDHRTKDDRLNYQYNWFSKFDSKYFYDKFFKK